MINLLLCGNKKVFDGALTQLISMTKRTQETINCYILTMDLSRLKPEYVCITDEQVEFLNEVIKSKNPQNKVTKIDVTKLYEEEFMKCKNESAYCTPYTLLRLLIDEIPNIPDKILYLDIDMMIGDDISKLYNIDIDGYEYAAVREKYGRWLIRPDYINAGMLLFNMKMAKETKLFEKARKISPCIVFIDEIDAIGSRRTSNSGAETENNQTLNQLLVEMDGFSSEETIIVLAATNRPEMLDKALLRPGRFDRQITIPAPDIAGREEILKIHSKDKKLANDVSLHSIAEDTAGFTGAELANILNEAAIIATKNQHNAITNDDLDEAVKKVTVGLEKTSRKISDKDKKLTAYHEAGHAIVSQFLPTQTAVKEISIVPRGVAGGYTMYKSDEDKSFISKTEMEEKLIALLGGRAAEKIVLDDISTGASNDIEVATEIAKNMVTVYGMSDVVGPICLKSSDGNYEYQLLGNNMEDIIGQEVKKLIDTAYKSAQQILLQNMDLLHAIAAELIAKEKINEEEFNKFFM